MGELIRAFDWSKTSLGPVSSWPQSLRTTLSIMLTAKLPMGLWWGEELLQFYNDAYRPCLGNEGKHPRALGQSGPDCWPEVWPLLEPLIQRVLAGGEATWQEDVLIPIYRNGSIEDVYWTFSYSPVRDESGQIAGVMVLCQDTTRQVEGMRLSGQRFQNFVHQARVGIIVLSGQEMVVEVVNHAYGRLIDRRCEELLNRPLFSVIPEARPYFHPILEKVRLSGEPLNLYDHPYFVLVDGARKDGFLDLVYQPYRELDGSITGVMVLCHEVTEKVVARRKLEESEEHFRTFANNIQNLAWMASPEGWIYWYNQRWHEYTGTNLEEMQGWGWEKVHHPDHLDRVVNFVRQAWVKGETWELTFPLRGARGQYRWFLTRAYAVKDAKGQVLGWIGTNTDVDDQKRAEVALAEREKEAQTMAEELAAVNEELRAANDQIQASNAELGLTNGQLTRINQDLENFVYTASHDLKAPILNLEGLLKVLERRLGEDTRQDKTVRQVYGLLYDSVNRFKTTIGDLTEVARISKESQEDIAPIAIKEVLEEVLRDLQPQIEEAAATLELPWGNPVVQFSRKNMKSILYNLLSNALKYRSPERQLTVRITCQAQEHYQVLTVEDNGLGMDMHQEEKIFALFKRLHSHVEGTGVGLYMVKKILENAGGKIQVESQVDVGSTFSVYFKR